MQKLCVNDEVVVLHGKDRGKTGRIVKFYPSRGKVLVSKINMVKRARKREEKNADDFVTVERPVERSRVALVSPKTKKATRVRIETREGKRVRVAVACGSVIKRVVRQYNKKG